MVSWNDLRNALEQRAPLKGPDSKGNYRSRCMLNGHTDNHPSLDVHPEKGFICRSCGEKGSLEKLAQLIGLQHTNRNDGDAIYYTYDTGPVTYRKVRKPGKTFYYETLDAATQIWTSKGRNGKGVMHGVPRVLYNQKAIDQARRDATVFAFEGEKDAERAIEDGLLATSSKDPPLPEDMQHTIVGKPVIIIQDHDVPGRKTANKAAVAFDKAGAASVKVVKLYRGEPLAKKDGRDYSDWRGERHKPDELRELASEAEELFQRKVSDNPWSKAVSAPDFMATEDKEVEWIEEPTAAPGSITELFAPRGLGKTHYTIGVAVKKSKEGLRVLYIDRDNSKREVKRRLRGWGTNSDTKSLKILTRDNAPPLTDGEAWSQFPFKDYDLVIIDSLDSSTEGVGEKDSGKPSEAISSILDIAHRDDGPAIVVNGNTTKNDEHGRGSGVIEDRADIVFEIRDATDLRPTGTKDWWEELPEAGRSSWAQRAGRRKKRDRYRLAFVASKFRIGEEPDPFVIEIRHDEDPWQLVDVTEDVEAYGEQERTRTLEEKLQTKENATKALVHAILSRPEDDPILKEKDAVPLLMEHGLTRKEARILVEEANGSSWVAKTLKGRKGNPVALLPCRINSNGVNNTGVNNPNDFDTYKDPISADRMNKGRRKSEICKSLLEQEVSTGGVFPPVSNETHKAGSPAEMPEEVNEADSTEWEEGTI